MIYKHRGFIIAALCIGALTLGPHGSSGLWIIPWNLGIALRIWARRYIGAHTRLGELAAPVLALGGPYAWLRHPLYLSNILIICGGIGFWLGFGYDWLLLTLLSVSFYDYLAHAEDLFLQKAFADSWSQWKLRVPYAFVPMRRVGMPQVRADRNWFQAVWADHWTWLWMGLTLIGMLWFRRMHGI